jgi:hypothetical protein
MKTAHISKTIKNKCFSKVATWIENHTCGKRDPLMDQLKVVNMRCVSQFFLQTDKEKNIKYVRSSILTHADV